MAPENRLRLGAAGGGPAPGRGVFPPPLARPLPPVACPALPVGVLAGDRPALGPAPVLGALAAGPARRVPPAWACSRRLRACSAVLCHRLATPRFVDCVAVSVTARAGLRRSRRSRGSRRRARADRRRAGGPSSGVSGSDGQFGPTLSRPCWMRRRSTGGAGGSEPADGGEAGRGMRWDSVPVDGHRVRYGVTGSGPPALFLHGWGLRPNAYRAPIQAMASAGCRVYAPSPARLRRHPRARRRGAHLRRLRQLGGRVPRRGRRRPAGPGRRPLLRWRGGHRLRLRPARPGLGPAAGQRHRQPDLGPLPQRGADHHAAPGVGLGPPVQHRPVPLAPPAPAAPHPARGLHPQPAAQPARACSAPASSSGGPTWSARSGPSPARGAGDRGLVGPRPAGVPSRPSTTCATPPASTAWWSRGPTPGSSPIPARFGELAISALVDSGVLTTRSVARRPAPERPPPAHRRPDRPTGAYRVPGAVA